MRRGSSGVGFGAVAAVAALVLVGCSSTGSSQPQQGGGAVMNEVPQLAANSCPGAADQVVCMYAYNNSLFFDGPDSLGPRSYWQQSIAILDGCTDNALPVEMPGNPPITGDSPSKQPPVPHSPAPSPTKLGGCESGGWAPSVPGGIYGRYEQNGDSDGANVQALYSPPAPLPGTDLVWLVANDSAGSGNAASCGQGGGENSQISENPSVYTRCRASITGGDNSSATFNLTNTPLTIKISNNLPQAGGGAVVVQGTPSVMGMVLDSAGGSGGTVTAGAAGSSPAIGVGESGYFGAYLPSGDSPVVTESVFAASYGVAGGSMFDGGTFGINAVFNNQGQLDSSSTCGFTQGQQNNIANCDMKVIGQQGGPMTLLLNFHN